MHLALLRGLVIVALSPMVAFAQGLPPLAHGVVGGTFEYTVQKGDTFESIGSRKGLETAVLAKLKGLKPTSSLKAGQVICGDNGHVIPADLGDGILVNLPQRKLFLIRSGDLVSAYPVAPGKPAFKTLMHRC